jgi:hypothetical protein
MRGGVAPAVDTLYMTMSFESHSYQVHDVDPNVPLLHACSLSDSRRRVVPAVPMY